MEGLAQGVFEGHYPLPALPSRVPQPRISIVKPGACGRAVGRGFLKEGYRGSTWGGLVDTGTWWGCLGPTAWRAGAVGTPTGRDHTALGHAVPRLPVPGTLFLSVKPTPPQPKLTAPTESPSPQRKAGCRGATCSASRRSAFPARPRKRARSGGQWATSGCRLPSWASVACARVRPSASHFCGHRHTAAARLSCEASVPALCQAQDLASLAQVSLPLPG